MGNLERQLTPEYLPARMAAPHTHLLMAGDCTRAVPHRHVRAREEQQDVPDVQSRGSISVGRVRILGPVPGKGLCAIPSTGQQDCAIVVDVLLPDALRVSRSSAMLVNCDIDGHRVCRNDFRSGDASLRCITLNV